MTTSLTRRRLLTTLGTLVATAAFFSWSKIMAKEADVFALTLSDAEWRQKLSPDAYRVLRGHGTEPAGSSPLNTEHRPGTFHCAGCDWPLFAAVDKYNSGTGWPSFTNPLNDRAVGTTTDYKLVVPRTEVHCANCGGHLGHVFDDGPAPTGKRYCMNGVALAFKPG
jgi:peptide-methionine (R)-S-oxide reductase